MRTPSFIRSVAGLAAVALLAACGEETTTPLTPTAQARGGQATLKGSMMEGPFELPAPVFDIAATPDGSVMAAVYNQIAEVNGGGVTNLAQVPTAGSAVQGIAPQGRRALWVTSGGLDLAVSAGVWRVANGSATLVGDIEAFETAMDPDANVGTAWKNPACEAIDGNFSAGPQANPYHLMTWRGGAVVADAAGNMVYHVRPDGTIRLLAVVTPPEDGGEWAVLGTVPDDITCYVQPVPTSVAPAPDGGVLVGELTGLTPDQLQGAPAPAWSRVWHIAPGAEGVSCPSDQCTMVMDGFTSIIDLEMGPDGWLYVVEYDEAGWFAGAVLGSPTNGTIHRCNPDGWSCEVVADDLSLPGAVTFDGYDRLWVLENGISTPTVSMVEMD